MTAVSHGDSCAGYENPTLRGGSGIVLVQSDNNTLTGNVVTGNPVNGIKLDSSDNNNLSGNVGNENGCGISLVNADNNIIAGNDMSGNLHYDILVVSGSRNNTIYNNNPGNDRETRAGQSGNGTTRDTEQSPGADSIGGTDSGGNVWALPDGNGWSRVYQDIARWFAPAAF